MAGLRGIISRGILRHGITDRIVHRRLFHRRVLRLTRLTWIARWFFGGGFGGLGHHAMSA